MSIVLLYHYKTNGYVCKRIAQVEPNKIIALSDREPLHITSEDTLVRWDSKKNIDALKVINTIEAVILSRNKTKTRLKLVGLCPTTWTEVNNIKYPCIIRPKRHYGGYNLFLCNNIAEASEAILKCGIGWYASEFIDKEREYRVFVFKNKTIKVIRRTPGSLGAIAWNSHNGGNTIRVKRSSWPPKIIAIAIEATKRIGLDLCAVDVIVDRTERPFVLELNTAPGLKREETFRLFAETLINEN